MQRGNTTTKNVEAGRRVGGGGTSRGSFMHLQKSNPFEFSEANAEDWMNDDIKRRQEVAKRSRIKGDRHRLAAVQEEAARIKAEIEDIGSFSQEIQKPKKPSHHSFSLHSSEPQPQMIPQKRKLAVPEPVRTIPCVQNTSSKLTVLSIDRQNPNHPRDPPAKMRALKRKGGRYPTQKIRTASSN